MHCTLQPRSETWAWERAEEQHHIFLELYLGDVPLPCFWWGAVPA